MRRHPFTVGQLAERYSDLERTVLGTQVETAKNHVQKLYNATIALEENLIAAETTVPEELIEFRWKVAGVFRKYGGELRDQDLGYDGFDASISDYYDMTPLPEQFAKRTRDFGFVKDNLLLGFRYKDRMTDDTELPFNVSDPSMPLTGRLAYTQRAIVANSSFEMLTALDELRTEIKKDLEFIGSTDILHPMQSGDSQYAFAGWSLLRIYDKIGGKSLRSHPNTRAILGENHAQTSSEVCAVWDEFASVWEWAQPRRQNVLKMVSRELPHYSIPTLLDDLRPRPEAGLFGHRKYKRLVSYVHNTLFPESPL